MPLWWGKSPKDVKKKLNVENIISSVHRKCIRPGIFRRQRSDSTCQKEFQTRADPLSLLPSKQVLCSHSSCQKAQPLPLPGTHVANSNDHSLHGGPRNSPSPCLLISGHVKCKACAVVDERNMAIQYDSSDSLSDTDGPCDSRLVSTQASDYEGGMRLETTSPSGLRNSREMVKPAYSLLNYRACPISPEQRHVNCKVACSQPHPGVVLNTSDSSVSSPSRSPSRLFCERATEHGFWPGMQHAEVPLQGLGQSPVPGSVHNSRNNSFTEDISSQLLWPNCRCSPECSPVPSPRMMSPGPGSRIHSGGVSPRHPPAGATAAEPSAARPDDGRNRSHPLPLPPLQICNPSPFIPCYSPATSPKLPRSPGRTDNPSGSASHWKKGRPLGRGTFGQVYLGFNSESGEMCAMKEVTLFSDDSKSKESAQQLGHEILLLSRLRHPNIVQYYGSEMVDNKLYIYLEYVSGGSVHKILQDYGQLGEAAIRSYTQQILSGLAYLHAKNTIHRDIKGANILVDPNGRVRLADFGMAKHITGHSCPLSFKGSPYWMAPEVITNSSSCNLAVDIWSLGCTVLEMATAKPPWSQYEGVAALFKVGNSKELPEIPDHLSDEGKDFVLKCLQRNPSRRPTAAQLLEHPFVKKCSSLERPVPGPLESIPAFMQAVKTRGSGRSRISPYLDSSEAVTPSESPKFKKGRVSPAPSGASTPPGGSTKATASPPYHLNTTSQSSKPKIFRGFLQKAHSSVDKLSRGIDFFEQEFERPIAQKEKLYDTHMMLADRVSPQLSGNLVTHRPKKIERSRYFFKRETPAANYTLMLDLDW
ncbi:Mitogen-activated protein kinase kinase kinase YODA [Striga hermonthica]|uniref:mitogen-activated protein kinase kinase kinase n=1 Tax=Striga hermonthica TaxID=68872 RepID=A0A9N7MJP2_STRHE|nr:Mitogen-activated protein kinase kinase kinase YODA [Striga hermonthica]